MKNKIKSLYVTGINGWLGQSLISAFEKGIEGFDKSFFFEDDARWIGLDISSSKNLFNNQNSFYEGDISNYETCNTFLQNQESDVLIHMASLNN